MYLCLSWNQWSSMRQEAGKSLDTNPCLRDRSILDEEWCVNYYHTILINWFEGFVINGRKMSIFRNYREERKGKGLCHYRALPYNVCTNAQTLLKFGLKLPVIPLKCVHKLPHILLWCVHKLPDISQNGYTNSRHALKMGAEGPRHASKMGAQTPRHPHKMCALTPRHPH